MEIIVAPDSFKGSLTAIEAAQAMRRGIHAYDPTIRVLALPIADGGEGTMDSLVKATEGKTVTAIVQDPLGRDIAASYGILGDGKTAVIEIAAASGLELLKRHELNPLIASSFGTGQLIRHALDMGIRQFTIGLGGSATNEGGAGLLQALGVKLLDRAGSELPRGGGPLHKLETFNLEHFDERIFESSFVIACDVDNPFIGPSGASAVFGPQKGATPTMVQKLDDNLQHFADTIERSTGISLHAKKGAGAAGGVAGALQAFFPAEMKQGIGVVLDTISFTERLKTAQLVITGEGKTDRQTLAGKAPYGVAEAVRSERKPVILISGMIEEEDKTAVAPFFTELHAVTDGNLSVEEAMNSAASLLQAKTEEVVRRYFSQGFVGKSSRIE